MEFSRQEYWSGLPCLSPGNLPNPGIKPRSPALQADSLPFEPPGKPENWWDALKTTTPAAGTGQQNGHSSSPRQCLIAHCTTATAKVGWIGLQSFASSAVFTWPLPIYYHFFKHLEFLQSKHFHNQQEAKNAFQEFIKSQSTDFYTKGINKLVSPWQKCVDYNGPYFD